MKRRQCAACACQHLACIRRRMHPPILADSSLYRARTACDATAARSSSMRRCSFGLRLLVSNPFCCLTSAMPVVLLWTPFGSMLRALPMTGVPDILTNVQL